MLPAQCLAYRDSREVLKSKGFSVQVYEISQFFLHLRPHYIPRGPHRLVQMKDDWVQMGLNMLPHPDQSEDTLLELPLGFLLLSIRSEHLKEGPKERDIVPFPIRNPPILPGNHEQHQ